VLQKLLALDVLEPALVLLSCTPYQLSYESSFYFKEFSGEISWKISLGCLTGMWDHFIMRLVGESNGCKRFGPLQKVQEIKYLGEEVV
jgi:hypothetical protein